MLPNFLSAVKIDMKVYLSKRQSHTSNRITGIEIKDTHELHKSTKGAAHKIMDIKHTVGRASSSDCF